MKKFLDILFKILAFMFLPLLFTLIFWWGSIPFIKENYIFIFFITGLIIGLILNLIYYKKIIRNLYNLNIKFLIVIYLFYNFCIYGFFMGIPIFNLIMSFISGLYFGRRCKFLNYNEVDSVKIIKKVSIFTTIFVFIIFCFSGFIAIKDPSTGKNIQGMFNLSNPLTKELIYLIVIFGGTFFLILNYYITYLLGILEFKKKN
ncbi:MAG TPA: hypothetical protein PLW61_06590 [Caldisericia bacterium]|nr:hypothetical protein [Caldisericia bacterium]HPB34414.1 hypothetical protein [Caldisericia bacterium]HQL67060.1 hypothetical protein [Caldisericia bacterium]HQN48538.1 hypothetical protein [Caldisericia bacterium]HQP00090.1 hypothetical protein [Caldisericia bacterium]